MDFDRIDKFSERLSYILSSFATVLILIYIKFSDYGPLVFAFYFFILWGFVFFIVYIIRVLTMEALHCIFVDKNTNEMVCQNINEIKLDVISKPDEECSICIEPCDKCVQLQCGHYFHVKCINLWMEEQMPLATCPNCRAQVVEHVSV